MERDSFLSRVGQATLTSQLPAPPLVSDEMADSSPADLVALFRTRAQSVNAVVHGPMSRHGAARAVTAITAGHEGSSFMSWDSLPAPGVISALGAAGLRRIDHEVSEGPRGEHNLSYLDLDIGITGADGALAESGTLILDHGPGRPRMASLIPEIHIALLETSTLVRTLADWAREHPEAPRGTANLVFVTGPSRTGDIEQELNLGVHGPRHVHIVMLR